MLETFNFMKTCLVRILFYMFGRIKLVAFTLIIICAAFVILYGMYCPVNVCAFHHKIFNQLNFHRDKLSFNPHLYLSNKIDEYQEDDIRRTININLSNEDVLVFLHIQKTGGTLFEKHLVKLGLQNNTCICKKGKKKCNCRNKNGHIWIFSRYSTGWSCGLHADWTELRNCVENKLNQREKRKRKRRFYYFTLLRNPVERYISEWKHVQRGATWDGARLVCNGRSPTEQEWPICYKGGDWVGVPLQDFLGCRYNLANNRQTRMLANLSLVHCYDLTALSVSVREERLLASARDNLREMAYFGIADHIVYSQYLFHRSFNLTFKCGTLTLAPPFTTPHLPHSEIFTVHNLTHSRLAQVTEAERDQIRRTNRLDLATYDFALQLFYKRLRYNIETDPDIRPTVKAAVAKAFGPDAADPQLWFSGGEAGDLLTRELIRVMTLSGSRLPDPTTLDKRQRRWHRKLEREMDPAGEEDAGAPDHQQEQ